MNLTGRISTRRERRVLGMCRREVRVCLFRAQEQGAEPAEAVDFTLAELIALARQTYGCERVASSLRAAARFLEEFDDDAPE